MADDTHTQIVDKILEDDSPGFLEARAWAVVKLAELFEQDLSKADAAAAILDEFLVREINVLRDAVALFALDPDLQRELEGRSDG